MAGLLAADGEPALLHLLHHVLVADRCAHELDAALAECELEADVAHDRRDDRIARQVAGLAEMIRRDQQHRIAVDDLTMAIDEQRAIAVTVERDAETRVT